jgi:spermidine synthase
VLLEPLLACYTRVVALPWKTLAKVQTPDGPLELRQRGEKEYHITINGLILMNSVAHRSEAALGTLGAGPVADRPKPRALVAGLGLGITLRAVLDALPPTAQVTVAELNPVVVEWCRGPLAELTRGSLSDPRVTVEVADVTDVIERASKSKGARFDALVLDLYTGPASDSHPQRDPFYGSRAIERMRAALEPGGMLAVWGEAPDRGYTERLTRAGFTVKTERPGKGGLRHVVYLARA